MAFQLRNLLLPLAVLAAGSLPAANPGDDAATSDVPGVLDLFIYIEDDEVRHEVLMPLRLLEVFLPISREDPDVLTVAEQEDSFDDIAALLGSHAILHIDGMEVLPDRERVVFFDKEIMDITGEVPAAPIDAHDCLVGVIYRYPTLSPPSSVTVTWSLYHTVLPTARCTAFPYEDAQRTVLSASQPEYTWRSRTRRPLMVVEPVAAEHRTGGLFRREAPITGERARDLAELLIRNVYRAFHYRREERIYDSLAQSLSGDLLSEVYLAIRRGLEIEAEGGGMVRIDKVTLDDFTPGELRAGSFTGTLAWIVEGRIEHWGHIHERENVYTARLEAERDDDSWRITGLTVRDARRLGSRLLVREIPDEEENGEQP
ncbi:MAG: hypothetical protein JJU11_17315 [Candidatus Sumerlaeia bacterium]|nr:hypothetical protein [Candidatus Sumerlaeia bacterium]